MPGKRQILKLVNSEPHMAAALMTNLLFNFTFIINKLTFCTNKQGVSAHFDRLFSISFTFPLIFRAILNSVDSWTVESMAKAVDMSVTEFAAQTGRALTGQTTSQDNFVYQAKPQGANLQVGRLAIQQVSRTE